MTISNLMKMAGSPSKWVENTVEKGEIARYEQFLLFQQCFQKTFCRHVKPGLVWQRVNAGLVVSNTGLTVLQKLSSIPRQKLSIPEI